MQAHHQAALVLTDMAAECGDILAHPAPDEPIMVIEQDDDTVCLDRDGARALGEFLLEWATPKPDKPVAAVPISRAPSSTVEGVVKCSFCDEFFTAAEVLGCRRATCPAKPGVQKS